MQSSGHSGRWIASSKPENTHRTSLTAAANA